MQSERCQLKKQEKSIGAIARPYSPNKLQIAQKLPVVAKNNLVKTSRYCFLYSREINKLLLKFNL